MEFDEHFFTATVAFLHIPKCAGQSVVAAFSELYREEDVFRYYPPDDISHRGGLVPRLITGHFNFGYQYQLAPAVRTVTVLRHPVDRLVSQIYFDRDVFNSEYGSRYPELKSAYQLHNAVEIINAAKLWIYDNCMVRMLSGVGSAASFGCISDAHLEIAKRNLEKLDLVGFQDDMASFSEALKLNFGYEYFNVPLKNDLRSRGNPLDIQMDERELADLSKFDMQFYYWARSRTECVRKA